MCLEKHAKLVTACKPFTKPGAHILLRDFWALQGHLNWALNVYPLLQPALSGLYDKTAGKDKPLLLLTSVDTLQALQRSYLDQLHDLSFRCEPNPLDCSVSNHIE